MTVVCRALVRGLWMSSSTFCFEDWKVQLFASFTVEQDAANFTFLFAADRLAQLVEHRTAVREVAGSNLGRINTQGL